MPVVEEWTYLNAFFASDRDRFTRNSAGGIFCEQDRLPFSNIITLDVTNAMRIYLTG